MSIQNIANNTSEDLYASQREQAEYEDSAKYRMLQLLDTPEPEEVVAEGKDWGDTALETAEWLLSPFAALGDASAAPLAHNYQQEGLMGKAGEAIQISGKAFMDRILPTYGAEHEDYGGQIAGQIAPNASQGVKSALGLGLNVLTDPTIGLAAGSMKTIQRGMKLSREAADVGANHQGILQRGVTEMLTFGEMGQPQNTNQLMQLAQQADLGSKRAAKTLFNMVDSDSMKPLLQEWDAYNVTNDFKRTITVGGKGIPTPKKAKWAETALKVKRRDGDLTLLSAELVRPIGSPYKHSATYLKMNSPNDIQSFQNVYVQETMRYVENSLANATPMQRASIEQQLTGQVDLLKQQIGDTLNAPVNNIEAFANRRMMHDLAVNARKQVNPTELKFHSNIDYLRFWTLISARESVRANLTGSKSSATGLLGHLNTEAAGSMAMTSMKVDRAIKRIPELSTKLERRLAVAVSKQSNADETERLLNMMFNETDIKKWEGNLHKYWLNSILSSPVTHSRNIVSNLGVALLRPIEEIASVPVALAKGNGTDAAIHVRRSRAMVSGMVDVGMDMMRTLARVEPQKATNLDMFKGMNEANVSRPRLSKEALKNASTATRAIDYVSSMLPMEMLGRTDTWFKALTYTADLRASAVETASRLTKDPYVRRQLANRLFSDPLEHAKAAALRQSELATFQNPLGDKTNKIIAGLKHVPAFKWVAPFVTTPLNITAMGIKHTPFTPIFKSVRDDLMIGGTRGDLAAARMAIPSFIGMAAVANLDDRITGADNQRLRLNQMPAYSIKMGDQWISYQHIEPLRWILGPMANLKELATITDWDSLDGAEQYSTAVAGFVGAYAKVSLDNNFVFQLANIVDSIKIGSEGGSLKGLYNQIQQTAAGMMPNAVTWYNRAFLDQNVRELDTFTSRIMNRTPGLSKNLPPKVGLLGEPQTHTKQYLNIFPAGIAEVSDHPIYAHISSTGAKVPDVPKSFQGVKLDAVQRATIRVFRAEPKGYPTLNTSTLQLLRSPSYRTASIPDKAEHIKNLISKYNTIATTQLYNMDTKLRDSVQLVKQR